HAIETLTEYRRYLHGEAVAIGMACAARVSIAKGTLARSEAGRIESLLAKLGLPTTVPRELVAEQIALTIEADKKAAGGKIKCVCLAAIGKTTFEALPATEIAKRALG